VADSFEQTNDPLNWINGLKFLDYLNDYELLKKDSAPCLVTYTHIKYVGHGWYKDEFYFSA